MTLVDGHTISNSNYTMKHFWIFVEGTEMVNQLLTYCEILFVGYYAI